MRHDRPEAFELRKQGKTYREIEKLLGVSRSTLCEWFRNEEWSKHIKKTNTKKHIKISTAHLKKLNEGRRLMLEKKYKEVEEEAEKEFELYKNEGLFHAGLMLYVGEGGKTEKNNMRLANVDFNVHKTFITFCEKYLNFPRKNLKFALLTYPDLDTEVCISKWSEELEITRNQFYKVQVISGREKIKRLHFGVGTIIILNTCARKKLFKWTDLAFKSYEIW
ncbi:hypothetical protein COU49_00365 [Candidatus Nomurabacteria bacterium CG10_big_fil_rev_8_21_14_0_10_35_16]|uniref:Uncharacterized protein n=1 Tax=Candidatus Nomurabacteria bacterium CG10_big_fil_rev_8_21_14_0_10_35_16 TaxID=1974731 RepID=A0A2H0TDK3_9BACT|nr:MAG: hypothetical protein COU49_00365 [Candidatus Nomurabacteria bacterium CG10_big_fil_rev_8_21_14_0_10_35_16]